MTGPSPMLDPQRVLDRDPQVDYLGRPTGPVPNQHSSRRAWHIWLRAVQPCGSCPEVTNPDGSTSSRMIPVADADQHRCGTAITPPRMCSSCLTTKQSAAYQNVQGSLGYCRDCVERSTQVERYETRNSGGEVVCRFCAKPKLTSRILAGVSACCKARDAARALTTGAWDSGSVPTSRGGA